MNDRERILTMLSGGLPDRVPWFGDLTYWAGAMEHRGQAPKNWQRSEDYYRFHRELGVGFYLQGYYAFQTQIAGDVQIEEWAEGDLHYHKVTTPVGTLTDEWHFLEEACTSAPIRRMVKSVADLPALRYWYEHTAYSPNEAEALRRKDLVADLGVVLCYLPHSPFMELVTHLCDIDTLVGLWMEAPDELDETMRVLTDAHDRASDVAVTVPADCLMIPENLSSEVVGRRFYEQFMRAWESKWVARIREAGKYSYVHMDGTLRGLIRQVGEAGFDVIEAVTPEPVGDVSMKDARNLAGPGPILWGGIPGLYFTALVSDTEFERHVREMLDVMVEDKRMVLGVADQVPPDGLRSRVAAVVGLAERYGRY
ncbi:MAG: uroporphyrinogen decarboxylase family protein [Anaerolineae bacterium]